MFTKLFPKIKLIILFFGVSYGFGNNIIDSLENVLQRTYHKKEKLNLYLDILQERPSENYEQYRVKALKLANDLNDEISIFHIEYYFSEILLFDQKTQKAKENYEKCKRIATKLNNDSLNIKIAYGFGLYNSYVGENEKVLPFFNEVLNFLENNKLNSKFEVNFYRNLGREYYVNYNYEKAKKYFLKALYLSLYNNYNESLSLIYYYLAGILIYENKDYRKGIFFLEKSIERRIQSQLPADPYNFQNMGIAYLELGDYKKAIKNFEKALSTFQQKISNNNKGVNVPTSSIKKRIGFCKLYLATTYIRCGLPKDALSIYNELLNKNIPVENSAVIKVGIAICNYEIYKKKYSKIYFDSFVDLKKEDPYENLNINWLISDYYLRVKDYDNAINYTHKIIDDTVYENTDFIVLKSLKRLSSLYSEIGDFEKANNYNNKFISLSSRIKNRSEKIYFQTQNLIEKVIENQKSTDTEIANHKVELLQKSRTTLLILSTALILILFLIGYYLRSRYLFRISKKQIENELQSYKIKSIIDDEESRKKEISYFVHEKLSQNLISAKYNLNNLKTNSLNWQNQKQLIENELTTCIKELRKLSYTLSPTALDFMSLEDILDSYCEEVSKTKNLIIHFKCIGTTQRISKEKQLAIYRIVQELVTNRIKHSNVNYIMVQLIISKEFIIITLEEKGSKFNHWKENVDWKKIEYRMSILNATHKIHLDPEGTNIQIQIAV